MKNIVAEERTEVRNPYHPTWSEFVERIKNIEDQPQIYAPSFDPTEEILDDLSNIDVLAALEYLESMGASFDYGFFTEVLGMNPEDPNFPFLTQDALEAQYKLILAIEDGFNRLKGRGYSKEWIKKMIDDFVIYRTEMFSK